MRRMTDTILSHLRGKHLILGSQSPRRHDLLQGLDLDFEQLPMPDIDESYPVDMPMEEIPIYLAQQKATAYRAEMTPETVLITADTIVITAHAVLGKPHSYDEAVRMLRILSGRTHTVVTGVCLSSMEEMRSFGSHSRVTFATLSDDEITYYLARYKPYDKAGAYGVQEWIGYIGIEHIEGSFYNVMGLPVHRLYRELCTFGIL